MTPDELAQIKRSGDLYALGAKPSGVRPKDYVADLRAPAAAPPRFTHAAVGKVPVHSQQGGTCVGNAIADCMTYLEYSETNDVVPFDGEALNMRVVGKDYGEGAAASPHDVLDDVTKHGAQGQRGLYFPKGYAWVDWNDREALKAALSSPGVVVTAAIWLQQNFGMENGKAYAPFHDEEPWGYHEIHLVGYDDQGVLVQNSWGTWWGDGGFCRLSWDYVAHRFGECWAITDNPDTLKDGFVKTIDYGSGNERAVKHKDLPTRKRPAVYLVKSNGRIWITDPFQAKRFGVNLYQVEQLDDTDPVWALPVIGPDAARDLR